MHYPMVDEYCDLRTSLRILLTYEWLFYFTNLKSKTNIKWSEPKEWLTIPPSKLERDSWWFNRNAMSPKRQKSWNLSKSRRWTKLRKSNSHCRVPPKGLLNAETWPDFGQCWHLKSLGLLIRSKVPVRTKNHNDGEIENHRALWFVHPVIAPRLLWSKNTTGKPHKPCMAESTLWVQI